MRENMAADTDLKRKTRVAKFTSGVPPADPAKCYVNLATEDQMEIEGYTNSRLKLYSMYFLIACTLGILRLLFHWFPQWYLRLTHRKCELSEASRVLLKDQYEQWFVAVIQTITRDGTRVAVLKPSASLTFSAKSKRKRAALHMNLGQKDENLVRYFVVKKVKYIWNSDEHKFEKLSGLEANNTCSYFHQARGLSYEHQRKRRVMYGNNTIDVHVSPIVNILFKEALTPFYVFQVFSVLVWYFDEYYYYASCIVLISAISLTLTIYQTRKMQRALRNTIQTSTVVSVCRGEGVFEDIPSDDLVPGDVIEIPHHGCQLQCDAALISGNCIVNESTLTGESVPVTKTPLPDTRNSKDVMFNMKEHARHTLFCGTQVIQTRYYGNQKVRAVVLRTGFLTSKGELVRAILYPKPVDFKFNRDTYFFVGVLFFIAGIGLVYTVALKVQKGDEFSDILKRSLDVITIAVPPALPAALTVGIVFAQARLKSAGIYCISPRSINICGSINAVCFDKTGTLTEDGLNMQGVVPVKDGRFTDEITNMVLVGNGQLAEGMATCHSLTLIDGHLSGDPLDLIMFESINWILEEAGEENRRFDMLVPTIVYPAASSEHTMTLDQVHHSASTGSQIGIVRQFTFSSSLQRMSVIVRRIAGSQFEIFSKGSPEMISSLCKPETVPADFHQILRSYTQHGYRVLALAWKQLSNKYNYVKVQRVHRDKVEADLTFLGLLVMENKLKPETTPVIQQLTEANIRTVMVTGDNMLTALSVAHDCKIVRGNERIVLVEARMGVTEDGVAPQCSFVEEINTGSDIHSVGEKGDGAITSIDIDQDRSNIRFAVAGGSWEILRLYFPDILSKVLVRCAVFARMSPDNKAQLVECLQKLGYYVAMCGDGANDCGALKMAHTGISLSEAEASVASPFTSKKPNIECVPTVVREGRAALVTSFGIFKYMACYSLTQFVSVLILYQVDSNLTDFEFLYVDLFLLTSLSVTYGRAEAYPKLAKEPPQLSLTSFAPIMSIICQMVVQIGAQMFAYFNVQQQPWFEPHVSEEEYDYMCYENAAVFSASVFQYIILSVAFSKGAPYRKAIYHNRLFMLNVLACIAFSVWLTVYPPEWMQEFFELQPAPSVTYRLLFFGIAAVNCLLSIILETFVFDHEVIRTKLRGFRERCCPGLKFEYSHIQDELAETPSWPPVGDHPITAAMQTNDSYSNFWASETDKMLPSGAQSNDTNTNFSNSLYALSTVSSSQQASMTTAPTGLTLSRSSLSSLPSDQNITTSNDAGDSQPLVQVSSQDQLVEAIDCQKCTNDSPNDDETAHILQNEFDPRISSNDIEIGQGELVINIPEQTADDQSR